jgi:hypothetical protein
MRLNDRTCAPKWARLKLIDMMILEILERNFWGRNTHKIGIDAAQYGNVTNNYNAATLTL